jgi:uncharacterized radical SAM superfamily Fe-S cluster-containing enzyme
MIDSMVHLVFWGYKDFIVDYDMDIDDLNKYVAQYAYSKGDISWMTVGKSFRTVFVQPMYERFTKVRDGWEKVSDDDSIVLWHFAHESS